MPNALYFDDFVIMSPSNSSTEVSKKELSKRFDTKELGSLHTFLGLKFIRETSGAWILQGNHVSKLLERFGMQDFRPVFTPMSEGAMAELELSSAAFEKHKFQELLGALLYIST